MYAGDTESFEIFFDLGINYSPIFELVWDTEALRLQAEALCGDVMVCLFDFMAIQSEEIAQMTLASQTLIEETNANLGMNHNIIMTLQ